MPKKKAVKKRVVKKKAKAVKRKVKTKARKVRAKVQKKAPARVSKPQEKQVGIIEHFYDGISVAALTLTGTIKVGDKIHIKGATTDFTQKVESMQIDHKVVKSAGRGDAIGIKVKDKSRSNDIMYVVG
jgi:putative protease